MGAWTNVHELLASARSIMPNKQWVVTSMYGSGRLSILPHILTEAMQTEAAGDLKQPLNLWNGWKAQLVDMPSPPGLQTPVYSGFEVDLDQSEDTFASTFLGLLRLTSPEGEELHIFTAGCDHENNPRSQIAVDSLPLLRKFNQYCILWEHKDDEPGKKPTSIWVASNSRAIELPLEDETIIMGKEIMEDLHIQLNVFFRNKQIYDALKAPYKRGILLSGPPGNGKTLLARQIMRTSFKKYGAIPYMITPDRNLTDKDLVSIFHAAASGDAETIRRKSGYCPLCRKQRYDCDCDDEKLTAPVVLIMDEVDSLLRLPGVSRATLLNLLDGVGSVSGLLIVATTNNPDRIDPALVNRPSRFDRVFSIGLPDKKLRKQYLTEVGEGIIPAKIIDTMATQSKNWSFAYLKELMIMTRFVAAHNESLVVTPEHAMQAFNLLKKQHKETMGMAGYGAGGRSQDDVLESNGYDDDE